MAERNRKQPDMANTDLNPGAAKMKLYREQKRVKHREKKLKKYHERKDFYNTQKKEKPENEITENSLKNLILPGAILAVYTDDENEDFYIVLCKGEERILDVDTHDDWGNLFCTGSSVIDCLYYDKVKGNPLQYKLINKKKVMIPPLAVKYIPV